MIVCIQLGLPLPLIIDEFVVRQSMYFKRMEQNYILIPVLIANILLDLVCIVLLLVWVYRLWKRKLLKSKAKFVCTLIIHTLLILVVFLIGNIIFLFSNFENAFVVYFALRTVAPVSFGVYVLVSLPHLQRKVTRKAQVFATNRHTNPPSTRVSLPTDTAEHAPNFLSPSTAESSEVTSLINN